MPGVPKARGKVLTSGSLVQAHASSFNPQRCKPPLKPEQHPTRPSVEKEAGSALTSGRSDELHWGHPLRRAPLARTLPPSSRRASCRHPHRGAPAETRGEVALAPGTSHLQHLDLIAGPPAAALVCIANPPRHFSVAGASAHLPDAEATAKSSSARRKQSGLPA